jgi:outer membrane protein TolC
LKQAELAAEAAARSYDLVVESYTQGAVSIVELIDAQRATRIANQVAANARFDFLIDLMKVQRALGRFAIFWTNEEREEFFKGLGKYYDENIDSAD